MSMLHLNSAPPTPAEKSRYRALLAILIPLCVQLGGCFLWGDADSPEDIEKAIEVEEEEAAEAIDDEVKEIKGDDKAASSDETEAELLRTSKRLYQAGLYSVAETSLTSLRDRFPLGAYGSWASIKAADAYFYNGEFDKAANFFEEFLKNFPGSPDTPYVKLQAARAHLASAKGTGRDRQPLERSLTLFDELDHDYPDTPYAVIARSERTPALEDLTAYDRFIIDFYRKKGNQAAVDARTKAFNERWGSRMNAGEFLKTSEEVPLEPFTMPAPAENSEPQGSHATENTAPEQQQAIDPPEIVKPDQTSLLRVTCDQGDMPFAMLEVAHLPEELSVGNVIEEISPTDGVLHVPYLKATSPHSEFNCFAENDLTVSSEGTVQIRSNSRFILTTLSNPTRILLTKIHESIE